MNGLVAAIRRFFGIDGEGLLNAATKDFQKIGARIEKAGAQIAAEFGREVEAITEARQKHSAREFQSRQTLAALSDSQQRTARVAAKIADLIA
jgi:transcription initiation factor TFIID subunit TAF12